MKTKLKLKHRESKNEREMMAAIIPAIASAALCQFLADRLIIPTRIYYSTDHINYRTLFIVGLHGKVQAYHFKTNKSEMPIQTVTEIPVIQRKDGTYETSGYILDNDGVASNLDLNQLPISTFLESMDYIPEEKLYRI